MVCVAVEALRLVRTELLVLASGGGALISIDLSTGGLVRSTVPPDCWPLPFDVVSTAVTHPVDADPTQPDAIELAAPLDVVGRVKARRAERFVAPLLHPDGVPLLGVIGPSAPYWTITGSHPSVAVVDPNAPIEVVRHGKRLHCFFTWMGNVNDLPIVDRRVAMAMAKRGQTAVRIRRRFVVALTPPHRGNCYKVVAGLLPRN